MTREELIEIIRQELAADRRRIQEAAVGPGPSGLSKALNRLEITRRIEALEGQLAAGDHRHSAGARRELRDATSSKRLEAQLDNIGSRVADFTGRLGDVEANLDKLTGRLNPRAEANLEELDNIGSRVADFIGGNLDELREALDRHARRIRALTELQDKLVGRIDRIERKVGLPPLLDLQRKDPAT